MSAEQTQNENNTTPAYAIVDYESSTILHTAEDFARYLLVELYPQQHGVRYLNKDGRLVACVWWSTGKSDTYEHVAWVDSEDEFTEDEVLALWVENDVDRGNSYGLGGNVTVYRDRSEIIKAMADVEEDDPEEWARLCDMAVRAGWLGAGA